MPPRKAHRSNSRNNAPQHGGRGSPQKEKEGAGDVVPHPRKGTGRNNNPSNGGDNANNSSLAKVANQLAQSTTHNPQQQVPPAAQQHHFSTPTKNSPNKNNNSGSGSSGKKGRGGGRGGRGQRGLGCETSHGGSSGMDIHSGSSNVNQISSNAINNTSQHHPSPLPPPCSSSTTLEMTTTGHPSHYQQPHHHQHRQSNPNSPSTITGGPTGSSSAVILFPSQPSLSGGGNGSLEISSGQPQHPTTEDGRRKPWWYRRRRRRQQGYSNDLPPSSSSQPPSSWRSRSQNYPERSHSTRGGYRGSGGPPSGRFGGGGYYRQFSSGYYAQRFGRGGYFYNRSYYNYDTAEDELEEEGRRRYAKRPRPRRYSRSESARRPQQQPARKDATATPKQLPSTSTPKQAQGGAVFLSSPPPHLATAHNEVATHAAGTTVTTPQGPMINLGSSLGSSLSAGGILSIALNPASLIDIYSAPVTICSDVVCTDGVSVTRRLLSDILRGSLNDGDDDEGGYVPFPPGATLSAQAEPDTPCLSPSSQPTCVQPGTHVGTPNHLAAVPSPSMLPVSTFHAEAITTPNTFRAMHSPILAPPPFHLGDSHHQHQSNPSPASSKGNSPPQKAQGSSGTTTSAAHSLQHHHQHFLHNMHAKNILEDPIQALMSPAHRTPKLKTNASSSSIGVKQGLLQGGKRKAVPAPMAKKQEHSSSSCCEDFGDDSNPFADDNPFLSMEEGEKNYHPYNSGGAPCEVSSDLHNFLLNNFNHEENCFEWSKTVSGRLQFAHSFAQLYKEALPMLKAGPLFVSVEPPVYTFGDIHGNFLDLSFFLDTFLNLNDLTLTASNFLCLGDYVDRGPHSLECLACLLSLKTKAPNKMQLLRGNHEDRVVCSDRRSYGSDCFLSQCQASLGTDLGAEVFLLATQLFRHLPLVAEIVSIPRCISATPTKIYHHQQQLHHQGSAKLLTMVQHRILCTHGGIPRFEGSNPKEQNNKLSKIGITSSSSLGNSNHEMKKKPSSHSSNDQQEQHCPASSSSGMMKKEKAFPRFVTLFPNNILARPEALLKGLSIEKLTPPPTSCSLLQTEEEQEFRKHDPTTSVEKSTVTPFGGANSTTACHGSFPQQQQANPTTEQHPIKYRISGYKFQLLYNEEEVQTWADEEMCSREIFDVAEGNSKKAVENADQQSSTLEVVDGDEEGEGKKSSNISSHLLDAEEIKDAWFTMFDLLWSDPAIEDNGPFIDAWGFGHNARGQTVVSFNSKAVETYLNAYQYSMLFRAHQEKAHGLRISKSSKVLTLFSSSNYQGHKNGAGCAVVLQNGEVQLVVKTHT